MIVLTHTIRHLSGWLGERWGGAWPLMRSPRDRFTLIALRVRSRIIARSNSAKTEAICAIARPYAWVISKPSPMDTSWMPRLSKSSITLAASATDRKSRSSFRHDHDGLAFLCGGEELAARGTAR